MVRLRTADGLSHSGPYGMFEDNRLTGDHMVRLRITD